MVGGKCVKECQSNAAKWAVGINAIHCSGAHTVFSPEVSVGQCLTWGSVGSVGSRRPRTTGTLNFGTLGHTFNLLSTTLVHTALYTTLGHTFLHHTWTQCALGLDTLLCTAIRETRPQQSHTSAQQCSAPR